MKMLTRVFMTLAWTTPALAQVQLERVTAIEPRGWWWQWGALLGITAVITLVAFKNPKRTHNA